MCVCVCVCVCMSVCGCECKCVYKCVRVCVVRNVFICPTKDSCVTNQRLFAGDRVITACSSHEAQTQGQIPPLTHTPICVSRACTHTHTHRHTHTHTPHTHNQSWVRKTGIMCMGIHES